MKRIAIIIIIICSLLIGIHYYRKCYYSSETLSFIRLSEAAAEIELGWLPNFLPSSAKNILEKRDYEQNKVIAHFSFEPSENFLAKIESAEELPIESLKDIYPGIICKNETWFPSAITEGKHEKLPTGKFKLYKMLSKRYAVKSKKTEIWYLLLNESDGKGYLWAIF